jgi:hypothetical protein
MVAFDVLDFKFRAKDKSPREIVRLRRESRLSSKTKEIHPGSRISDSHFALEKQVELADSASYKKQAEARLQLYKWANQEQTEELYGPFNNEMLRNDATWELMAKEVFKGTSIVEAGKLVDILKQREASRAFYDIWSRLYNQAYATKDIDSSNALRVVITKEAIRGLVAHHTAELLRTTFNPFLNQ